MLLVELFENAPEEKSIADLKPGIGMLTVYRVSQRDDLSFKPDTIVTLSADVAKSYAKHISTTKKIPLWVIRGLVNAVDVYKTDHPDRYSYKGGQVLGKKVTEVNSDIKETKFYDIKGGFKVPASIEESELIETIKEKVTVKNEDLNEREQEVARILTSRGLLERIFIDSQMHFKFNKLSNIHRY
jgi:hypothetical protein